MTRRLLLLSGGIDSAALAWHLRPELCLTVNYGQLAAQGEIRAAGTICKALGLNHKTIEIDCRNIGSGDLAGKAALSLAPKSEWWPFRNQLLITFAAAVAVQEDFQELAIGTVATDTSHADGRPEFVRTMDSLLSLQEGAVRLAAPGINFTTVELCRHARLPREIFVQSHSCQDSGFGCGVCRGCHKRVRCMKELGFNPGSFDGD